MITTLEQAMERIAELETENKALREALERYKNISPAGRKKHDENWMASYNDFAEKYESGMMQIKINLFFRAGISAKPELLVSNQIESFDLEQSIMDHLQEL